MFGRRILDDDEDAAEAGFWTRFPAALWRGMKPAMPAAIGAAALTFLFAAVMPLAWVAGISWNLYLDRLSDFFVPPIGNGGRLVLALGLAAIAATLAGLVALALTEPVARSYGEAARRPFARAPRPTETDDGEADGGDDALHRRRADRHPDDPPRPPIRAVRDLPAEGLGPVTLPAIDADHADALELSLVAMDDGDDDELILADLAPVEPEAGAEPWLQPAEIELPRAESPMTTDRSLGAMVARLEAGLARRNARDLSLAEPANEDAEPTIDFALEAALGTLQRMTRSAVG